MSKKTPLQAACLLVLVLALAGCTVATPTAPPMPPTATPAPPPSPGGGRLVWELTTDVDYTGPVQQAAVQSDGRVAYLATTAALYRVEDGWARPFAERIADEATLALAPDASVYAWFLPQPGWQGLSTIQLFDISGSPLAELRLEEAPYGFNLLYLGAGGELIVAGTPLDEWDGIHGRYLYTFWDRSGTLLNEVIFPSRQLGFVASDGTAILFLGDEEATAFDASGNKLWTLPGQYRYAVLASGAQLALLNPSSAEEINQVLIHPADGSTTTIDVPSAVHHLALAPDGATAAVVGDDGLYFWLDPTSGALEEGAALPRSDYVFVSDVNLVDQDTLAFGLQHRRGDPPEHSWPLSSIAVMDRAGNIAFLRDFPLREPVATVPAVDVIFGSRYFIGYTEDTTVQVELP